MEVLVGNQVVFLLTSSDGMESLFIRNGRDLNFMTFTAGTWPVRDRLQDRYLETVYDHLRRALRRALPPRQPNAWQEMLALYAEADHPAVEEFLCRYHAAILGA